MLRKVRDAVRGSAGDRQVVPVQRAAPGFAAAAAGAREVRDVLVAAWRLGRLHTGRFVGSDVDLECRFVAGRPFRTMMYVCLQERC